MIKRYIRFGPEGLNAYTDPVKNFGILGEIIYHPSIRVNHPITRITIDVNQNGVPILAIYSYDGKEYIGEIALELLKDEGVYCFVGEGDPDEDGSVYIAEPVEMEETVYRGLPEYMGP